MMDGNCNQDRIAFCFRTVLGLLALACFGNPVWVLAQEIGPPAPASDRAEGIVLLKNGQLLMGQATASVDRTIVETPSGSRIFLKTDDIRFICNSWREAWEFQRDAVNIDSPQEMVELMQWCLRHHLLVEARQVFDRLQLTSMRASDLDHYHRMLVSAEKVYETSQRRLNGTNPASMVAGSNPATSPSDEPRIQDEKIQPASFVTGTGPALSNPVVAAELLDRFSASVPEATMESWRRNVEPVLLQGCSNAGCHGPNDTILPLMSIGNNFQTPLRMSQQNLYWTARTLLGSENGCEPFLSAAKTGHGGQTGPAIRPDSNEFARIRQWAQEFCSGVNIDTTVFAEAPKAAIAAPESIRLPGTPATSATAPRGLPQRSVEPDVPKIPANRNPLAGFPKIPDLANGPEQFVPVDEFDPQIFNRFLRETEATSHNQARALGLPDLQALIGKEKTPEK